MNCDIATAEQVFNGEFFATVYSFVYRYGLKVVGQFVALASPQPGEDVLDLGCGYGWTAIQAKKLVGSGGIVVGIDIAKPMLHLPSQGT